MDIIDANEIIERVEYMIRSSCGEKQQLCIDRLYPCQREALLKMLEKFLSLGFVRGIVQMPTGTGKTVLAAALILAIWLYYTSIRKSKLLAIFLAPRTVIRRQTHEKFNNIVFKGSEGCIEVLEAEGSEDICERIHAFINPLYYEKKRRQYLQIIEQIPSLKNYFKHIQKKPVVCKNGIPGLVVVATPQLLHSLYKRREKCLHIIINNTDILIMDEIHTFYIGDEIIKTIKSILEEGKISIAIGLTATPVKDSIELLGELIYNKLSKDAMREGILVSGLRIIRYRTNVSNLRPIEEDEGRDDEWRYAIRERAKKYAETIIHELYRIRDTASLTRLPKTLIVAANTREADFIYEELKKLLHEEKVRIAHYRIEDDEPHSVIEDFKKDKSGILITVNMADIGFDDPNLEVLVLARPITNPVAYVQLRGRVLRKTSNVDNLKKLHGCAVIIDLVSKKDIRYLEGIVSLVEKGWFPKSKVINAINELKGVKDAPIARADVDIKRLGELLVGDIKNRTKPTKQTPSPTSPIESINKILNEIRKRYKIELVLSRKPSITIWRETQYTKDSYIINIKHFLKDKSVSANQIRNMIIMYIQGFLEKWINEDINELKRKYRLSSTINSNDVIRRLIEILADEIVNRIIYVIQQKKHKLYRSRKIRITSNLSRNDLAKYIRIAIDSGEYSFKYNEYEIKLIKTQINERYYIKVYINDFEKCIIKITKLNKMVEKLINALNN